MKHCPLLVAVLLFLTAPAAIASPGGVCELAADGKARVPIVVSASAHPSVRHSAEQLRDMLGRITGATFEVQTGDGSAGLAVGMLRDFPALDANARLESAFRDGGGEQDLASLQSYLLSSHAEGVQVIGASELAVEFAVWDLLHRMGYRQFFPGDTWEVVPRAPTLAVAVDDLEKPDYYERRLACVLNNQHWEWFTRNRMLLHNFWASRRPYLPDMPPRWKTDFVQTSHAYSYIVRDHADVFAAHPEWMALSRGKRGESTFLCISQPGLRAFVADYAVKYLQEHPEQWSVSLEPTDGDGWCECDECQRMGKVSNRAILLANAAAEKIEQQFPGQIKYVGLLGYGFHWQPPDIPVHERVSVMVTTKTLCPGLTDEPPMEERLAGWAEKASNVGVYDYWSVFGWGGWTTGHASASDPQYLADAIPRYHGLGARTWLSEADDSWGACGLGYYVASRLLWDVDEGQNADAIIEDFLDKAFGPAKEPMRAFYEAVHARHRSSPGNPNALRGRLSQMYPPLLRARDLAVGDVAVRKRIDDLLLYTRFIELYTDYLYQQRRQEAGIGGVTEADVREAVKPLMRLCHQIRRTNMVNYTFLEQSWMSRHKLTLRDLAPPGAEAPPELTDSDIDAIAADAAARYGAVTPAAGVAGTPFAVRNGDVVLVDAEGFEPVSNAVAASWESQEEGSADADPADGGQTRWEVTEAAPRDVQVTSAPESVDDPGPFDGEKYCRLMRGTGGSETNLRAHFPSQATGTIVAEWMAHGDPRGAGDHAMQFSLRQGSQYHVSLVTRWTGEVYFLTSEGDYQPTGLMHDSLKWETWRLRYAPGADHFELSIGDQPAKRLPTASAGPIDGFEVRAAQAGAKFYVDGVSPP